MKADCRGDRLDLLTLSHFHSDHIGGVVGLLNIVGTKTVMLPSAPLWHRLAIGFDHGPQPGDAEPLSFVDPVAYLTQESGGGFERVVFVTPSDGEGPSIVTDPIFPPPPTEGLLDREKEDGPGERISPDELDFSVIGATWRIRKLQPGHSIGVRGVWEFVPNNDPSAQPDDPPGIAALVDTQRSAILDSNPAERKDALQKLREHHEAIVGRAAMNDVGLMLYAGAVGAWRGQRYCDCDSLFHRLLSFCRCWKERETRGAILLTGDGNLSGAAKWASLDSYLSAKLAKKTSVLQVVHHGA